MGQNPPKPPRLPVQQHLRENTAALLARARSGDAKARAHLIARYLPTLQAFARGRLPRSARGLLDTDDLVQDTLYRAFDRIEHFKPHREGALLAYLRRILMNQVRDEARRAARRGGHVELPENLEDSDRTPLQELIDREVLEAYEAALSRLGEQQQQAVIMRLEFGFDYKHIADALGRGSANAARLVVSRALVRISDHMGKLRKQL